MALRAVTGRICSRLLEWRRSNELSAFSSFDEVLELGRTQVPEALQLEFKEKAAPDRAALDNGDKKVIAKAVSAFANSGGERSSLACERPGWVT